MVRDYLRAEAAPDRLAELTGALPGQAGLSGIPDAERAGWAAPVLGGLR